MKPKISVIIGIYNCAPTLAEALNSLLNQTYKDFEIILCDDGSTDNTYEIAKTFSDDYDNIILIYNKINRGLNYTLNKCLESAKGEYIARMDGDDISLPKRFEKEVKILDQNPEISIVSSSMIHFDEHSDFKQGQVIKYPQKKDFVYGSPFCHAPCMVRKIAYDSVDGYTVDTKLLRVEDYHLWFKMYSKGYKGYNIKESLYKMRDDRNAYSRRKFKYRLNEMYVKYIGFNMLNLPFYYQIFTIRPLLIWLLPYKIYNKLRRV